ncbi:hypothetical protein BZZ08_07417 [Streptomyces sp. MH60]|nr:hypothetical protein BZZ08_07417 [Streptomyces sp. MH60]
MAIIRESPIAESKEYRPPTQSQNSNMLAVSMPNPVTFSALVDSATKCLATAFSSPSNAASSQDRAEVALVIVSMVVKVLEAMTNSVSAGSRSRTASCRSAPSTLDTKRKVSARSVKARSAS